MDSQQNSANSQPINSQLEDLYQVIEDDLNRVKTLNKGLEKDNLILKSETELLINLILDKKRQWAMVIILMKKVHYDIATVLAVQLPIIFKWCIYIAVIKSLIYWSHPFNRRAI